MTENGLKACFMGLLAVTIGCLTALVITNHDGVVTNGLLALTGAVGGLEVWERLKTKGKSEG